MGAVVDLVAAGGAGGEDDGVGGGLADDGEEGEFADLHGKVVAVFAEAEGAGHAAAAGVEDFEAGAHEAFEEACGSLRAP